MYSIYAYPCGCKAYPEALLRCDLHQKVQDLLTTLVDLVERHIMDTREKMLKDL